MRAALRPEMRCVAVRAVSRAGMSTSTARTATTIARIPGSSSSSSSTSSTAPRRHAHMLATTPSTTPSPLQHRARFSHSALASSPPSSSSSPSSSSAAEATAPDADADADADAEPSSSPAPSSSSSSSDEPPTLYGYFPATLPDGPPPRGHFPIDTSLLRREFLRLQAAHHPDKHAPSGGPAKLRAERTSAAINHAYRTLADPLLRAQYLLGLRGVDVAHDEALRAADQPALLAAVMDAHEAIEEAVVPADLEPLRSENDGRVRESEEVLEDAFRRDDVDAAKREAVRLRYWVNIRDSIHNWEEGRPVVLQH